MKTKSISLIFASFLYAILAFSPPSYALEPLDSYTARLSTEDHFNSRGLRLSSVAAIVRQDRANYHKFGKRDTEDTYDSFFASKNNRAKLEKMIARGHISKTASKSILDSTPLNKSQYLR